jgi:hypothetical protein
MKLVVILFLFQVIFYSCRNNSIKTDLEVNLDKVVNLQIFDSVRFKNNMISYKDFRKMFKYISIVYLEDGCNPCYPKFIEWQNKIDSINIRSNHTILFIINGFTYDQFIDRVKQLKNIEDHYYTIIDKDLKFLLNNNDIPRWIIDGSMLIDDNNKIKMTGTPWSSSEMMNLFSDICQQ